MCVCVNGCRPLVLQNSRPGQCDEACAHSLLDRFVELGGNFIDTADVYQFGVSETIIGRWFDKHPQLRNKVCVSVRREFV